MRSLAMIGQNETARINFIKEKDVDLVFPHLQHCVVVVLQDRQGNFSGTHVDTRSNLDFLISEAKTMKGEYSLALIKNSHSKSRLAEEKIYPFINRNLWSFTKAALRITTTSTGVALYRDGILFTPELKHVEQLKPNYTRKITETNPLNQYTLIEGSKSYQIRLYERFITSLLDKKDCLPTLVFNGDWTGSYSSLSPYTQEILEMARKIALKKGQKEFETYIAHQIKHDINNTNINLYETLSDQIKYYWTLQSKELYSHIHRFFNQNKVPLTEKTIDLIVSYAKP